ncbi:hypothetical protein N7444_011396 [Penicillium canescens]|nr:hypothetical protein N7444_011396 [Penicillium canescens]
MDNIHTAQREDAAKHDGVKITAQPHPTLEEYERLFGVDEDAYEQPTTTRKELWSYYLYYNGDNGVGPGSYSQALFQWALNGAGHQPDTNPPKPCSDSSACVVPWAGGTRSVSSVVLIANGLCFAFMTVIFVWLGSSADYGTFGRWLLLALTVVCWALQYGMMAIRQPSQWPAAMGMYVVAYVSYGATLVFYAAVFPRLARYTPHVRKAREEDLREGKIDQEEYDAIESLERNHISNISTAHSNIGYLLTLVLNLSVLLPLQNNSYSNNLALCLTNSYWVVLGIWWFIFQQKRSGPKDPQRLKLRNDRIQADMARHSRDQIPSPNISVLFRLLLTCRRLKHNCIIQNDYVSFSFLQITYLGITQAVCSITSTLGFWYIQRYFKFKTKTMFLFTNFFSVLIPLWGMIGLWTTRIGYHNRWEFYFYNVIFGLFQAPYYAYAQTMISELMPRGYDNMFFALFGITNRASSIIGPNVIQAIINNTRNNWMGFPFLFAICAGAMITIWFVNIEKGREDCRKFTEQRKMDRVVAESGLDADAIAKGKQTVNIVDAPELGDGNARSSALEN